MLDLGAGEARTLLWLGRTFGHRVTAVDFSATALATAERRAAHLGVALDAMRSDLTTWTPAPMQHGAWDAVLVSFVHLLPAERQRLYRTIRRVLRPGGVLLAEWFAPSHLGTGYARIGPSRPDRMVPTREVRRALPNAWMVRCHVRSVALAESPVLRGRVAVTQVVARCHATPPGHAGPPGPRP